MGYKTTEMDISHKYGVFGVVETTHASACILNAFRIDMKFGHIFPNISMENPLWHISILIRCPKWVCACIVDTAHLTRLLLLLLFFFCFQINIWSRNILAYRTFHIKWAINAIKCICRYSLLRICFAGTKHLLFSHINTRNELALIYFNW